MKIKPLEKIDYYSGFLRYSSALSDQYQRYEKERFYRIETVCGMSLLEIRKLRELKLKLEELDLYEKLINSEKKEKQND